MASLNFKGKSAVWNHHLSVPYHTLEKIESNSLDGENASENLLIEWDNLLALKALLPKYQGHVKCVYIDPPYNTGKEGWAYNDNVSNPIIKEWLGKVIDKEDMTRHDKWLCMMTPRLKLLRELLAEDGVIFISIDENEVNNLRSLCDDIFREGDFLGTVVVQTATDNNPTQIVMEHEYVLIYSKNKSSQAYWKNMSHGWLLINEKYAELKEEFGVDIEKIQKLLRKWIRENENALKRVTHYSYVDEQGVYYPDNPSNTRPGWYDYSIIHPTTWKPCRMPPNGWRFPEETYKDLLKDNDIEFGDDESITPKPKSRLNDVTDRFRSLYYEDGRWSTNELTELFWGVKVFDNPKSKHMLKYFFGFIPNSENGIFLDSFAGSGTTAQAIMELNQEDGGNRKFILVQLPETLTEKAQARLAWYDFIHEITRDRIKKVVEKYGLDVGFTYYNLGPSIEWRKILEWESLPSWESFAKYVHFLATGKPIDDIVSPDATWEICTEDRNTGVYLIYADTIEELRNLAITRDWLEGVKSTEGKKIVYAPACFLDKEVLDDNHISFVQVPYNLFQRK